MEFSPKNPNELPRNFKYNPGIKDKPIQFWEKYSGMLNDDAELSKLEKEMFQAICMMLITLWDEVYAKKQTERESLFASYLHRKNSTLVAEFFKDDSNWIKFRKNILDRYEKYRAETESTIGRGNRIEEEIVNSAIQSIKSAYGLIQEKITNVLQTIKNELLSTPAEKNSSDESIVEVSETITNIVKMPLSADLDVNVTAFEADLDTFETEVQDIKSAFSKDHDAPEYQRYIKRLLNYKKININQTTQIFSNVKQIDLLESVGIKLSNYQKRNMKAAMTVQNFKKMLDDMSRVNSITDAMAYAIKRKGNFSKGRIRAKVWGRLRKFPKPVRLIAMIDFVSVIKSAVAFGLTYFIGLNKIAYGAIKFISKYSIRFFSSAFGKISSLISKLSNWFLDYISNPINAFKFGFVSTVVIKLISPMLMRNRKFILTAITFIKILAKNIFNSVLGFVKEKIDLWRRQYPFVNLIARGVEKIYNTPVMQLFIKLAGGFSGRILDFLLGRKQDSSGKRSGGIFDRISEDYRRKNVEFQKAQLENNPSMDPSQIKELDYASYLFNPRYFMTSCIDYIRKSYEDSSLSKIVDVVIGVVTSIPEGLKKTIEFIGGLYKHISKSSWLQSFLLAIIHLFTGVTGALATTIAMVGFPWGLFAIPLFIMGDMFFTMMSRDKKRVLIRDKYQTLFGGSIEDDYTKSSKAFLAEFKKTLPSRAGNAKETLKNFQENYRILYSRIVGEQQLIDKLSTALDDISKKAKEGKFKGSKSGEDMTQLFPKFTSHLTNSPLFNTMLFDKGKLIGMDLQTQVDFAGKILDLRQKILEDMFLFPLSHGGFNLSTVESLFDERIFTELGNSLNFDILNQGNIFSFMKKYKELLPESSVSFAGISDSWSSVIGNYGKLSEAPIDLLRLLSETSAASSKTLQYTADELSQFQKLFTTILPRAFSIQSTMKAGSAKMITGTEDRIEQEKRLEDIQKSLEKIGSNPPALMAMFAKDFDKPLEEKIVDVLREYNIQFGIDVDASGNLLDNETIRQNQINIFKDILYSRKRSTEMTQMDSETFRQMQLALKILQSKIGDLSTDDGIMMTVDQVLEQWVDIVIAQSFQYAIQIIGNDYYNAKMNLYRYNYQMANDPIAREKIKTYLKKQIGMK